HIYSIREQRAHNSYLEISAELGLGALVFYLVMIFAPLRSLRRIERDALGNGVQARGQPVTPQSPDIYYLSLTFQAALAGYVVCSFFGSIQYLWFLYYPLAYAVALRRIHAASPAVSAGYIDVKPADSEPKGVLWLQRRRRANR